MIIDPDVFLGSTLPDLSKWFNTSDVEYNKREDIANLIKELASNDKTKKVKFPKIKLPSRKDTTKTQSSKVEKLEAKIREQSIKSFKSDKLKSFDLFASKKPKFISDVQGARQGSGDRFFCMSCMKEPKKMHVSNKLRPKDCNNLILLS